MLEFLPKTDHALRFFIRRLYKLQSYKNNNINIIDNINIYYFKNFFFVFWAHHVKNILCFDKTEDKTIDDFTLACSWKSGFVFPASWLESGINTNDV